MPPRLRVFIDHFRSACGAVPRASGLLTGLRTNCSSLATGLVWWRIQDAVGFIRRKFAFRFKEDIMKDAAQVTSKLVSDLKAVIVDTEELLKLTAGQAGDKLTDVRSRLWRPPGVAKGRLTELEEEVLARAVVARPPTITSMKIPGGAIGAAAGITFLLGLLIGRR